jgi:hypothetical protein
MGFGGVGVGHNSGPFPFGDKFQPVSKSDSLGRASSSG